MFRPTIFAIAFAAAAVSCSEATPSPSRLITLDDIHDVYTKAFDNYFSQLNVSSVAPCQDFYHHVCGAGGERKRLSHLLSELLNQIFPVKDPYLDEVLPVNLKLFRKSAPPFSVLPAATNIGPTWTIEKLQSRCSVDDVIDVACLDDIVKQQAHKDYLYLYAINFINRKWPVPCEQHVKHVKDLNNLANCLENQENKKAKAQTHNLGGIFRAILAHYRLDPAVREAIEAKGAQLKDKLKDVIYSHIAKHPRFENNDTARDSLLQTVDDVRFHLPLISPSPTPNVRRFLEEWEERLIAYTPHQDDSSTLDVLLRTYLDVLRDADDDSMRIGPLLDVFNAFAIPQLPSKPVYFYPSLIFPLAVNTTEPLTSFLETVLGHETTHVLYRSDEPDKYYIQKMHDIYFEQIDIYYNEIFHENADYKITENLPDLDGLRFAIDLLKQRVQLNDLAKTLPHGDVNNLQMLFYQFATFSCAPPQFEYQYRNVDAHSVGVFRANPPLRYNPLFAEAFDCKPGDGMYRDKDEMPFWFTNPEEYGVQWHEDDDNAETTAVAGELTTV